MNKLIITKQELIKRFLNLKLTPFDIVYCVPNGGCRLAKFAIDNNLLSESQITKNISEADFILEDIIDSGKTINKILKNKNKLNLKNINFIAPINKKDPKDELFENKDWIVFPWEDDTDLGYSKKDVIEKILEDKKIILKNK